MHNSLLLSHGKISVKIYTWVVSPKSSMNMFLDGWKHFLFTFHTIFRFKHNKKNAINTNERKRHSTMLPCFAMLTKHQHNSLLATEKQFSKNCQKQFDTAHCSYKQLARLPLVWLGKQSPTFSEMGAGLFFLSWASLYSIESARRILAHSTIIYSYTTAWMTLGTGRIIIRVALSESGSEYNTTELYIEFSV